MRHLIRDSWNMIHPFSILISGILPHLLMEQATTPIKKWCKESRMDLETTMVLWIVVAMEWWMRMIIVAQLPVYFKINSILDKRQKTTFWRHHQRIRTLQMHQWLETYPPIDKLIPTLTDLCKHLAPMTVHLMTRKKRPVVSTITLLSSVSHQGTSMNSNLLKRTIP